MSPYDPLYFLYLGLVFGVGFTGMLVGLIIILKDKPKRNCDVGTVAEQSIRFQKFCHLVRTRSCDCSDDCPLIDEPDIIHCEFAWAQMSYKPYNKAEEDK